jgi:hypothetical protein
MENIILYKLVKEMIKSVDLKYKTVVHSSDDDKFSIMVRVFNVPKSEISNVKDIIFSLEPELHKLNNEFYLFPRINSEEETRRYFRNYLEY